MRNLLLLVLSLQYTCLNGQNKIVIDGGKARDTINRNIYGHFAEHLGHCIYGGFYVGENNSKIPNKDGVRLDVIESLKKLKVPVLRWPGGCFADTYHWREGIGPKNKRPSMLNVWWGSIKEDNSFGTNEFLNMCELLGAEPYISGNIGSGTPSELSDWVKYTTHPNGSSPMTDLRKQNGRKDPWHVQYWGLGNEAWGCGGNMKAEFYANIYRQYATFMSNWDNKSHLFRIASGASDDDYHWTEVLMKDIPLKMLDAVGIHHYSVIDWSQKGSATGFTEEQYFTTMQKAMRMEELVSNHAAIMDKYDPGKKVAIAVDEWGGWYEVEPGTNRAFLFQQNTMRDAMIAGTTLNIFNNHCDRVRMANLAQTINVLQAVILTNEEKLVLTPTYHVMEMYSVHQDALMLPCTVSSNDYKMGNDRLKAISASASKDKNGVSHISVVNIDANAAQDITIELKDLKFGSVTGRILTSNKIQNYNSFDNPKRIRPVDYTAFRASGSTIILKIPAFSVVVLELK